MSTRATFDNSHLTLSSSTLCEAVFIVLLCLLLNALNIYSFTYIANNCRFSGAKAMLSGPAGGVVGYAATSYQPEVNKPVIGFDMGGEWFYY